MADQAPTKGHGGPTSRAPTALERLLAEPTGVMHYRDGEAFLLHVFWEAPSETHARELLSALRRCAVATHRDTPCVPTYFFRVAGTDVDLRAPPPRTVQDHRALRAARLKIERGVPHGAVVSDLQRRGLDAALLTLPVDAPLPPELQVPSVFVEFTEIYLDERSFMRHAGSRDYLDAYGKVTNPSLQAGPPVTVRMGTPAASLVDTILEPMLKEQVAPLSAASHVWQPRVACRGDGFALVLALDISHSHDNPDSLPLPVDAIKANCTTSAIFQHPLRADTVRLLFVAPSLSNAENLFSAISHLRIARGEAHVTARTCDAGEQSPQERADLAAAVATISAALQKNGLGDGLVAVNATDAVGYVLHALAHELTPQV